MARKKLVTVKQIVSKSNAGLARIGNFTQPYPASAARTRISIHRGRR